MSRESASAGYGEGAARRATKGFTLVELLVALFITAVMFAIGYGELAQALRSRREIDEQSARLIAIQQAMRTIDQDFELLQPRPVRNVLGDGYLPAVASSTVGASDMLLTSSSSNSNSSTSPNAPLTPIVTFTRGSWTNPVGLQRSELQRVSYALQGDRLVREYTPVLDATLQDATITRTLLDHVKSFSLRFMDAGHNWQTQWPESQPLGAGSTGLQSTTSGSQSTTAGSQPTSGSQPQLPNTRPVAVEVTIELDDWGVIVRHIEVAG